MRDEKEQGRLGLEGSLESVAKVEIKENG